MEPEQDPIHVAVVSTQGRVQIWFTADFLATLKGRGWYTPVKVGPAVFMWTDREAKGVARNHLVERVFCLADAVYGDVVCTGGGDEHANVLPIPQRFAEALKSADV